MIYGGWSWRGWSVAMAGIRAVPLIDGEPVQVTVAVLSASRASRALNNSQRGGHLVAQVNK